MLENHLLIPAYKKQLRKIMNDKIKTQKQIKSGHMMQGICMQWFIDTYGFSNKGKVNGFELYCAILRKTFGYRQNFNYINKTYFQMSSNKMKRHRDYLTKLGVIEWKQTKYMTLYRILEPASEISTFVFTKQIPGTQEDSKNSEAQEIQIQKMQSMNNQEFNKLPHIMQKAYQQFRTSNEETADDLL